MKNISRAVLGLLLILSQLFPMSAFAHVTTTANLIANPSVETATNTTSPQNWQSNSWGTNTSKFSYLSTGHTGTRSVRSEITSYTSGDAKWYFTPTAIKANTTYNFGEFYKSNTSSEVVIQYTHNDNSTTYHWISTAPATTSWTDMDYAITTPANAVKLSIFHVIASIGWLEIDDYNLTEEVAEYIPPSTGLIPNESVETASANNSALPAKWLTGKWGTNTAKFEYLNEGFTGSHSLKTTVSKYTNGDAKWYFEPITIEQGKVYNYSHNYKSSITTDVVAQYTDSNGVSTYKWLNTIAPNSTWQQFAATLTIPAGATKMTILHVIYGVGWLQIDNALLNKNTTPPLDTSTIPNSSLEEASGGGPVKWQKNNWGSNTSAFEYMNSGRTGNKSVKVSVSNYIDGDAKWYFDPVSALERGKQYRFSAWYKTNALPKAVVMFTKDDGSIKYLGMPAPQPNNTSDWQVYSDTFTMPIDARSLSVLFLLSSNGWLQTDDYDITPYRPQGFSRPLVTMTFDDGEEENNTTALPLMKSNGFVSTQCYATTFIENADNAASVKANVLQFKNAGHEICSHTVTHPFLTTLSTTAITNELTHSKSFLETLIGGPVRNFASPYGDYNTAVITQIKKYYRSHRTVDEGYNSKDNFDIYRLRVQNMTSNTTLEEYQSWLSNAKATNTWLILVYHRVANDPGDYDTSINDFGQQLKLLASSGLTVKTYNSALDEIVPQTK